MNALTQPTGVELKRAALLRLEQHREGIITAARRVLLETLLCRGYATADDVRYVIETPVGENPVAFGAVPTGLVNAGIIFADGFVRTSRPAALARPVTVWRLKDRQAVL